MYILFHVKVTLIIYSFFQKIAPGQENHLWEAIRPNLDKKLCKKWVQTGKTEEIHTEHKNHIWFLYDKIIKTKWYYYMLLKNEQMRECSLYF